MAWSWLVIPVEDGGGAGGRTDGLAKHAAPVPKDRAWSAALDHAAGAAPPAWTQTTAAATMASDLDRKAVRRLEARAESLRVGIESLGTAGGYATQAMQAELRAVDRQLQAYRPPAPAPKLDPAEVYRREAPTFDTAKDQVEGGPAKPDGFTSLDDLDAIIAHPERFDRDVVATAGLLRQAVDQPGNEALRAQFERPSLWQQVKNSPWSDPNSDSLVVNLLRGYYAPAFIQRLVDEGPDAIKQVADSIGELSVVNQLRLAATDPGQLADNYGRMLGGAKDWAVDTVQLGVGASALTNPAIALELYAATGTNVYGEAADLVTGTGSQWLNDPDALASQMVGWEQLGEDPWRWAGNQAPDLVLELVAGVGSARLAARGLDAADELADAGQAARRLDDATALEQDLLAGGLDDAIDEAAGRGLPAERGPDSVAPAPTDGAPGAGRTPPPPPPGYPPLGPSEAYVIDRYRPGPAFTEGLPPTGPQDNLADLANSLDAPGMYLAATTDPGQLAALRAQVMDGINQGEIYYLYTIRIPEHALPVGTAGQDLAIYGGVSGADIGSAQVIAPEGGPPFDPPLDNPTYRPPDG